MIPHRPPFHLLAAAALTVSLTSNIHAQRPPNILYILADDLGYGEVSYLGQTHYTTPNIDRLAAEGVRFTDHYAGAPICAPCRDSLLTGRHTGHTTIRQNYGISGGRADVRVPLKPDDVTVAQIVRKAGYRTAIFGKWGLGEEGSGSEPWHKGFDEFYGFLNQAHAHNQFPEFLYRNEDKEALIPNFSHRQGVYANDRFTEETLRYLGKNRDRPFFLYLAYTTPHADIKCPADSIEDAVKRFPELGSASVSDDTRTFAAMVMRLDRDIGRIMARLKELGLEENTLVIFTSDNGPYRDGRKDNAFLQSAGPFRGMKGDVYEGGIREPFIARWPGRIAPGRVSRHVSAFWDFFPTACEIAGVPAPAGLDGVSYLPELLGDSAHQKQHDYLYWELLFKGRGQQAVRRANWKAVRLDPDAAVQLYDLAQDPGEQRDVASQHPDLVRELAKLIDDAHVESPYFPLAMPKGTKPFRG